MFKKIEKDIEKVQKSRKKEYSKSINREKKIEKKNREKKSRKRIQYSSLSGSPEVKYSLSGSSHIAVTIIIRNSVLMANYSISANVFCLFAMSLQGKTQREEKRKKNNKKKLSNNHTGRSFAQKKTFKPRARNNNHTGRSFALACPYVRGRTCVAVRAKKN